MFLSAHTPPPQTLLFFISQQNTSPTYLSLSLQTPLPLYSCQQTLFCFPQLDYTYISLYFLSSFPFISSFPFLFVFHLPICIPARLSFSKLNYHFGTNYLAIIRLVTSKSSIKASGLDGYHIDSLEPPPSSSEQLCLSECPGGTILVIAEFVP